MPSGLMQESNPYEPKRKGFVIQTLCRVVAQAQSWDEVMSGCEALANAMRIAKDMEGGALPADFEGAAALDHLKEIGREIRDFGKGGSNGKTRQTPLEEDPRENMQGAADHGDHRQAQKGV